MPIVFDGSTRTIKISSDIIRVDIQRELYSRSIDWAGDNMNYPPPFQSEGGGYLIDLSKAPMIFRFNDSWKIEYDENERQQIQILRFVNGLLALQSREDFRRILLKPYQYYQVIVFEDNKFRAIASHRQLEKDLGPLLEKSHANGMKIGAIYMDIDRFKDINTEMTETVVDERILPQIIQILKENSERDGFLYREGGDEFICLFPICALEMLREKAENIRIAIQNATIERKQITISLGVSISLHESDIDVLARANQAKANAKRNGRNRVEMQ